MKKKYHKSKHLPKKKKVFDGWKTEKVSNWPPDKSFFDLLHTDITYEEFIKITLDEPNKKDIQNESISNNSNSTTRRHKTIQRSILLETRRIQDGQDQ